MVVQLAVRLGIAFAGQIDERAKSNRFWIVVVVAVGAVAGTLDIIPMIFQRLPLRSCLSAFFIYFFAAVIVFYSNLPYLPWWADGMAVTLMLMLPVLFTFSGKERKAIPVVLFNALLFGFLISTAEKYLA